jgi:HEAT repeat protein
LIPQLIDNLFRIKYVNILKLIAYPLHKFPNPINMINQTKVIDALCHLITTGDEVDRCYAARTLGILGDTQAIPTLIQCLRDEDIDVSIDAAEALGRIGEPSVVPALIESLTHDPNGEVKTAVVEALGKIEGKDVIAPLLEVAKSCPNNIAWDEGNQWNVWWDMQLEAVKALGRKRVTEAVPILSAILTDEENQDIESEVLTALALIGGEGEKVLIQRLTQGTPRERRRAATALGLSHGAAARKALAQAMNDQAEDVRIAAIYSLGKQNAVKYIDIMLRFLKDADPEMRCAAVDVTVALSANQENADIMREKLVPLLFDPNPIVRAATLKALSGIEDIPQETLVSIRQCLSDSYSAIISAASILLARLGDHTILLTLLQILSNQERDVVLRSQVATALGILGNMEALNILTWAVGDEEQSVRLAALNALMQLEKHQASLEFGAKAMSTKEQTNKPRQRTPLDVVIAALKGEIVAPLEDADSLPKDNSIPESMKVSASTDEKVLNSSVEQNTITSSSNASNKTFNSPVEQSVTTSDSSYSDSSDKALNPQVEVEQLEIADVQAQTTPDDDQPLSTLEAIARDNEEAAMGTDAPTFLQSAEDFSPDIQEYMTIAHENIQLGERLFVSKKWDVATDVRHLSARILGNSDREEAIKALIEVLNDDDSILRREATISLGHIAQRSPESKALANAFGGLVTHLKMEEAEMRLACVRTLGYLGNESAIPVLFDCVQDEESSIRTQAIHALITLIEPDRNEVSANSKSNKTEMGGMDKNAIIAKLVELLQDVDLNVRKATADALATLQYVEALDSIIDAAFADAGAAARDMGQALRRLDIEQSGTKLLKKLEEVSNSGYRRFVIEMLEEVFMPV